MRYIRNKMINIIILRRRPSRLIHKRRTPSKRIMHLTNKIRIRERISPQITGKSRREFLKLPEIIPNIHLTIFIQQHTKQRLRTASILNRLCGKKYVFCRGVVEGAVFGFRCPRLAGGVFEEEDYAVDLAALAEFAGFEGYEFFELDVFYSELFY